MTPNGRQRGLWRRRERGAAVVEYALFIGLLVLGTTAAIGGLEDDAEDYYVSVSDDIGDLPQNAIPALTTPEGDPITTTTQTPTTSSTTSTSSTSTSSTSTSSTTSSTTTSTSTTTTTIAPRSTVTQLLDLSDNVNGSKWDARVRVRLRHNITNAAIVGATVQGEFKNEKIRECVTDNNGYCSMTQAMKDKSNVLFTVIAVQASPVWDGVTASILLVKP